MDYNLDRFIKNELKGRAYEELNSEVYASLKMTKFLYLMKSLGYSIHAIRIVMLISANLREIQGHFKDKKVKKDLVQNVYNSWLDMDSNEAIGVELTCKLSDFLKPNSKNQDCVKKGLDELQSKVYSLNLDYIDKGGQRQDVIVKSAFISSYVFHTRGKGFKIHINKAWYLALVDISKSFNPFCKNLIFDLNENALIMYLYILSLPKIDEEGLNKGTIKKREDFLKLFGMKNCYDSWVKDKLLDRIQRELTEKADISFNYVLEKDNITIKTFPTKKIQINGGNLKIEGEFKVNDEKEEIRRIYYAVRNYKGKRELDDIKCVLLLEIYLKYPAQIITQATDKKSILRGKKSSEFIDTFYFLVKNHADKKDYFSRDLDKLTEEEKTKINNEVKRKRDILKEKLKITEI